MKKARRNGATPDALENTDPEAAADLLTLVAENPGATIRALGEATGLNPAVVTGLIKRMESRHPDMWREVKRLKNHELIGAIDDKIALALDHIDPVTIGQASAKDLGILLGILIEKKLLLEGRPTSIIGIEERKHINDMLPAIIKEAQRRGITIDVTPEEPTRALLPPDVTPAQVSRTEAKFRKPENFEVPLE